MILERLRLNGFRNFTQAAVEFRPRINFFVGQNGHGKTNLLEAVYLLSHGVTFRPTEQSNLIQAGSRGAKIIGHFSEGEFDYSVEFLIEGGRRQASVNRKRVNSTVLLKTFPTILFSPESLAAIKEGPEQRRHLIDEILISHNPQHARLLREQSRCLRARNKLLRSLSEVRPSFTDRHEIMLALDSLNKIYFILSTHLTIARIKALQDIKADLLAAYRFIAGRTGEDISVDYLISDQSALNWTDSAVFDAIRNRQVELASREIAFGASLVGPHKHDIKIIVNGNDSRFYCSQGQQRALILSLKIAQIVYHQRAHKTYPVLLLDDVLSELDLEKRGNLMKFLEGISAQILITATDLTWSDQFGFDRNSIFSVKSGHVESKQDRE